jgi:hypothetical protein
MRKKKRNPKNVLAQTGKLFAFIDEHPEKPQVKRINAILELLIAIRNEKRFDGKAELIDRMQQAFRRYRWTREIFFGQPGNDPTAVGPHVFETAAKRSTEVTEDDDWEYGAAYILLLIAEYYPDYLSRIDRCAVCHRWMLARKSDHRFCGGKCRQYEYDNDPKRQEQHRANMRRLYLQEKERAESAKRRVGFSKRARNKQNKSLR